MNDAAWTLELGNDRIEAADGMEVASIRVELDLEGLDMLIVDLHDAAKGVLDGDRYGLGDAVVLSVGYGAEQERLFSGEIVMLEPRWPEGRPRTLRLRALDRLHRFRRRARTRLWEDRTDAEIVRSVALEWGLRPRVDDTEDRRTVVYQRERSDAEFLKFLAWRSGRELFVEDRALVFAKRSHAAEQAVTLRGPTDVLDCAMRVSGLELPFGVEVAGWDGMRKERFTGRAERSGLRPTGSSHGVEVAERAFGREWLFVDGAVVRDQKQAAALAAAILEERAASYVTGTLLFSGRPEVRPGGRVDLRQLGRFSGCFDVRAVRHSFGAHGFQTEAQFVGAALGAG